MSPGWLVIALVLLPVYANAALDSYRLPESTLLEIRLTHSLASFSAHKGNVVEGVIIAPLLDKERVVVPMGSQVTGTVLEVNRVGLGLIHETAHLTIEFQKLTLPDGTVIPLKTQLTQINNARESVNEKGRVDGIRSTATLGYRANNMIAGLAMLDPIAYIYVNAASARMLRFSEPEIWFPKGTELTVRLLSPIDLPRAYDRPVPGIEAAGEQKSELLSLIRSLPYRTATVSSNKPSDLTNLVFLGSPVALRRAFEAAGWTRADRLSTSTGFLTLRSIAENQRYQSAPMSVLMLDEQRPYFEFSKSLNTFSKRHHTRIWLRSESWNGLPVLTASSTQDTGIQLSRKNKTFIHVIDTDIDNERTKIVNDLVLTGCVDHAELFHRPWIPPGASNATGEALHTDRRMAVLQLNDCLNPKDPVDLQSRPDQPASGPAVERGFRQGVLITRNDIYRGNLIYQGVEGAKFGIHYLKHKGDASDKSGNPSAPAFGDSIPAAPEDIDSELAELTPVRRMSDSAQQARTAPLTPPVSIGSEEPGPRFELGIEGGWLRFGNTFDATTLTLLPDNPAEQPLTISLGNQLYNGWAVGTSVTLNSWKYFSNEFSFDYQRGQYRLGIAIVNPTAQETPVTTEAKVGLLTNQFGYAFLANLRPREKRFRPYVAAGLAFQLLHLTDTPVKSSAGIFKVGLRNVGLILAAYDYANNPPLDGGGVFQFGFQYGGGIKYRFTRHWLGRIDYRETLSPQPNFIGRSIQVGDPSDLNGYTLYKDTESPSGPLREQRLTAGASFVF